MLRGINPALLDTRVRIQAPTTTRDGIGSDVITYSDHATCFLERMSKPGREAFEANHQVGLTVTDFKGRYTALKNVAQTFRLTEDYAAADNTAKWYYVISVQTFRREGYILLTAQLRDNG